MGSMQRSIVRPSVRLSRACGGFAAERRAGGRHRSTAVAAVCVPAAAAPHAARDRSTARSSKRDPAVLR